MQHVGLLLYQIGSLPSLGQGFQPPPRSKASSRILATAHAKRRPNASLSRLAMVIRQA